MITIFSAPKAFTSEFALIQHNAIKSWLAQGKDIEIILFGNDQGIKETANKYGIKHINNINKNKYGTPLLDDLFTKANEISKYQTLCYVNSDIIFTDNLNNIIRKIDDVFTNFLIVGKRTEIKISQELDFTDKSQIKKFFEVVSQTGKIKNAGWVDYFIFSKDLFKNIPPFAVGRTFWDKWLIWYAHSKNYPIIDGTNTITAVHQTHQYSQGLKNIWQGKEALNNLKMAGGWSHGYTISQADYKLNKDYSLIKVGKNLFFYFINKMKELLNRLVFLYPFFLKLRYIKNKIQSNFPKEET